MTDKKLSSDVSIWICLEHFLLLQLLLPYVPSEKSSAEKFFSSNHYEAFTSYNTYSEVCKLRKKKILLAYFLPLDTTYDTISFMLILFLPYIIPCIIYVHLVLRKSIRFSISIPKLI